ncbi:MAG TPA: cytochrome c biogenesis protein CcsA [Candidatus Acidoferrales bacterium]|nr:cytochrome c biogenesis protein CcsA [Candidatus Acidoferrales bacterium]
MKGRLWLSVLAAALIIAGGYAALFIAPDERTMHQLQRVFYVHVPIWAAMFSALTIAFIADIGWLWTRKLHWDWLAVSAVEVGVVSCTAGLATGMLWGRPAWGIWWTWDAKLTSAFVLWLLYVSYLLLRGLLEDPQRRATLSAVFGIFAFLDAPLVYSANRLFRTQHPAPVIFGGPNSKLDPTMAKALVLCIIAFVVMMAVILRDRVRLERMRHELEELREESEMQTAAAEVPVRGESK